MSSSPAPNSVEEESAKSRNETRATAEIDVSGNVDAVEIGQAKPTTLANDELPQESGTQREGWRGVVGQGMFTFSDFINDNLVAARYGTFAAIALLSAYGVSKTPLFFRYKSVHEIPGTFFAKRKTLHGRLVRVVEEEGTNGRGGKPILCLVRHLSPTGRLLNRNAFDIFHQASPAAAVGKRLEDNSDELLKVEIAGIQSTPFYVTPSHLEQPGELLQRLADQRTPVSFQLLARRTKTKVVTGNMRDASVAFPEFRDAVEKARISHEDQIAVCRLGYRPGLQIFRTDVATALVRYGRAAVSSSLYVPDESRTTLDCSSRLEDLKTDAAYLEKLGEAEYEAAHKYLGMWADPLIRADNEDTIEEADFRATAGVFKKIWRWMRG